jgi:hypothetical protein
MRWLYRRVVMWGPNQGKPENHHRHDDASVGFCAVGFHDPAFGIYPALVTDIIGAIVTGWPLNCPGGI